MAVEAVSITSLLDWAGRTYGHDIFFGIAIIIIVASILGFVSKAFKQPLIPAYVLAGIIIGPIGLRLVSDFESIIKLSEIGIAFLLFVVGLELDFRKLRDIGFIASIGGTIQIATLFLAGFLFAHAVGVFDSIESVYIGLLVAFSSTMVVIKLLSDKQELDTLHGRIIIGILLMEDIFAILAMSVVGSLDHLNAELFIWAILKGLVILLLAIASSRFIFPWVFKQSAKSREILFLSSLTVCFFFSILAKALGFSIVVGAFLAGVALANLPYNLEIISRVKPLRDFFSTLFFVTLGMKIALGSLTTVLVPLIFLLLIIIIMKPFLIMLLTQFFGYSRRTSFLTSISLAQTSEFSLIIATIGVTLGHISGEIFTLAVLLAVFTLTYTSYLIKFDNQIFFHVQKLLKFFDVFKKNVTELEFVPKDDHKYEAILIGYDRIGYSIRRTLHKMKKTLLVIDFNPDLIKRLIREKIPCMYGDIGDIEILERVNFKDAHIVISTVPVTHDNLLLLNKVKHKNHKATIFVTASHVDEALELYDAGADYVILPHFLGGDHVSLMLEDVTVDINKLLANKINHIEELQMRKQLGHEHPKQNHHHVQR